MKNLKLLIAGLILVIAFQDDIISLIPDSLFPSKIVVEINKPADEFVEFSKSFIDEITDRNIMSEVAVLNDEYANKLVVYKAPSATQILTIYTKVGKEVFADKHINKFPKYGDGIKSMLESVSGNKERSMSSDDLVRLSNLFRGLSWNLAEKLNSK